jgi:hypothetical protein
MTDADEFDGQFDVTGEADYPSFAERLAQGYSSKIQALKAKYSS